MPVGLGVEIEAGQAGFDAGRLARIDRHFAGYVDDGRLPGWLVLVGRHGKVVHLATCGQRDLEAGRPVETGTRFRIYSMTKPVTAVAAMQLYEEGAFALKDPVSAFIPAFADVRVYRDGPASGPRTEPATRPVRLWHLLTHTAGLTYGFHYAHPVDEMYRAAGFEWVAPEGRDLAECCDLWAGLPLLFEPGAEWNYSVASDVLGRVVEVVSGQPLDQVFQERIFGPLGMADTGFWVPEADAGELAALYVAGPEGLVRNDDLGGRALGPPACPSGGGGLVSTAADYHRFTQALLRGGELEGARLLGSRTLAYMARNHLPGGADLETFGRRLFAETTFDGVGYGLGFAVLLDPVANKVLSTPGELAWGGAASTFFWVDPAEQLTAIFLTQLMPSSTYPLRSELRQLVYQALVD
ncbi:MAG TPA: serine hydrolase domain-containing protein [Actinomycetes bacterium]|nr:serine hydrolase domain-containing protein [Actinomycetes bacterium]